MLLCWPHNSSFLHSPSLYQNYHKIDYNSLINNIKVTSKDLLQHMTFHCSADFVLFHVIWTGEYMVKITYTRAHFNFALSM